jgi:hypothetical protein
MSSQIWTSRMPTNFWRARRSDVSHLMNGHFSRFTTDKLLDFLKRLNRKVTIEVSRRHKGEPYQQVTFAP